MPGLITPSEFVEEALDDHHSPTTSTFVENCMASCRQTVSYLEQGLDYDREGLIKMKKAVKSIHSNGIDIVESEQSLSKSLEKLGANAMSKDSEIDIGAAFIKFSIVTKELSSLQKALMQNLNNTVLYPLDNILKGDLKGVKGDLKKPFERSWEKYESKILKIEKEKKQQAKEAGLIRTEISSAEVAEDMYRERKNFQIQMCEYLLKVNDIKTKKGVELLQHLVEYYHAQLRYYQDGLDHLKHFSTYIDELSGKLETIKTSQDEERKQLTEIKTLLSTGENGLNANTSSSSANSATNNSFNQESGSKKEKNVYNLHQLKGNKHYGFCKSGYLHKKSEGKMKMKVWQKRKCEINGFDSENSSSFLHIYHSDESKQPVKVNLLTCQVKTIPDDKCSFDLVSYSRTYHFQAEDELDAESWISVILNCKEAVLKKEFDNNKSTKSQMISAEDYVLTETVNELRKNMISSILKLPGNQQCVDCNSTKDSTWLSINFGILVCIECSGIHRELGVHISRIFSLNLDNIGISLLLLTKNMSNQSFNAIYEANLDPNEKISSSSSMEERCLFIKSKYLKHKFIKNLSGGDNEILKQNLERAILNKNIYQVLQCHAENNQSINWSLPSQKKTKDNALHMAIDQEDNSSLHLVDFLIQNSANINIQNADGNTALHLCVLKNKSEVLKLLLRSSANINIQNKEEKTPLQIARELNYTYLVELIELSIKNKKSLVFENLNIDWNLQIEETQSTDFSDNNDEDFNEEKLNAKEYWDWALGSTSNRASLQIQNSIDHQSNKRISKRSSNSVETTSILPTSDIQSRAASVVLEKEFNNNINNNNVNNNVNKIQPPPPPLPPHKKPQQLQQQIITAPLTLTTSNNSNSELSRKEQFLKNKTMMHSRTISDLGLKSTISGHRKNASIDLSNSFNNNQTNSYLADKNAKRRTFIDATCSQLPNSSHSTSQTNLLSSNQFINNNNNNSMMNKNSKIENKLPRRKQPIYIENRHLSNGHQAFERNSFESLPSSDDLNLNNSNNSATNYNNMCSNQFSTTNSYLPIPPRRKKITNQQQPKLKTAVALFDCTKDQDDELEFKKNDIIIITKEVTSDGEGWIQGRIGTREGLLPISFVRILN